MHGQKRAQEFAEFHTRKSFLNAFFNLFRKSGIFESLDAFDAFFINLETYFQVLLTDSDVFRLKGHVYVKEKSRKSFSFEICFACIFENLYSPAHVLVVSA